MKLNATGEFIKIWWFWKIWWKNQSCGSTVRPNEVQVSIHLSKICIVNNSIVNTSQQCPLVNTRNQNHLMNFKPFEPLWSGSCPYNERILPHPLGGHYREVSLKFFSSHHPSGDEEFQTCPLPMMGEAPQESVDSGEQAGLIAQSRLEPYRCLENILIQLRSECYQNQDGKGVFSLEV